MRAWTVGAWLLGAMILAGAGYFLGRNGNSETKPATEPSAERTAPAPAQFSDRTDPTLSPQSVSGGSEERSKPMEPPIDRECDPGPRPVLSLVKPETRVGQLEASKGGHVPAGHYVLERMYVGETRLTKKRPWAAQLDLGPSGGGKFGRRIGLRNYASEIRWNAMGDIFRIETLCPDPGEVHLYEYSVLEDGSLLLDHDGDQLHFARKSGER